MAPEILLAVVARIPAEGVATFRAYEAAVLPLLEEHGGRLQRRLQSDDGTFEVHLVSFESAEGLDTYRADPRRAAVAELLTASMAELSARLVKDAGST